MTRFVGTSTIIPLILLLLLQQCIRGTEASLLRATHHKHERTLLGCPNQECHPPDYFPESALETDVACLDSSNCDYGVPCVFDQGTFKCSYHVIHVNPCSLPCVSTSSAARITEPDPIPVVCHDDKTCISVADLMEEYPLLNTDACNQTEDCPLGECRFVNTFQKLQCDDGNGTYCGFPCVENESSTRGNIAFGGVVAESNTLSIVVQCTGIRVCESLSTILSNRTANSNLVDEGECTSTENCGSGAECRYNSDSDELKCDDSFGSYCDYDCVEDDLQVPAIGV